jgi:uncharacterized protein YlxP (DUF503 family)
LVVGTCTISLHIPDSGSLKSKRWVLRRIKDRVRSKFNASIAEVGDFDLWQRATLGIAVVSNDGRFANSVISKIVDLIESDGNAVVLEVNTDLR